jgi:hypothetical protein
MDDHAHLLLGQGQRDGLPDASSSPCHQCGLTFERHSGVRRLGAAGRPTFEVPHAGLLMAPGQRLRAKVLIFDGEHRVLQGFSSPISPASMTASSAFKTLLGALHVMLSPDGKQVVFTYKRYSSSLYIVRGLGR